MANIFTYNDDKYRAGDTVAVHLKVQEEGNKTRIQVFEGLIIKIRGTAENTTFTVRKIGAGGIGVEKILPVASPTIDKIVKKVSGKVRRAKLYYLRDRVGKRALKVKVKDITSKKATKAAKVEADEPKKAVKKTKPKASPSKSKAKAGAKGRAASKKVSDK